MRPDGERRTIAELGFRTWLTDVVWYHYKSVILFSLAAVVLLAAFFLLRENEPKPDGVVMVLTAKPLGIETYNAMRLAAASQFSDENDDGEVVVSVTEILLASTGTLADATLTDNAAKLATSFLHPGTYVYVMDMTCMEIYASEPGRYQTALAAPFGAETAAIPLESAPWAASLGLTGEKALFACIKTKPFNNTTEDETYYPKAIALVEGLLTAERALP